MVEEAPRSTADRIAKYVSLLSAYGVLLGSLYLWRYWSPFHVDYLAYIAISDVVKAAVIPVAVASFFFLTGIVLGATHGPVLRLEPGAGANTAIGIWLRRHVKKLVFGFAMLIAVLVSLEFPYKWTTLSVLVGIPLAVQLQQSDFLDDVISNRRSQGTAYFLLLCLPGLACDTGQRAAQRVREGVEYEFVVSPVGIQPAPALRTPAGLVRYIGHAGEVIFLWNPETGDLTISKLDSRTPLEVGHWPVDSPVAKASTHTPSAAQAGIVHAPTAALASATASGVAKPASRP